METPYKVYLVTIWEANQPPKKVICYNDGDLNCIIDNCAGQSEVAEVPFVVEPADFVNKRIDLQALKSGKPVKIY